MTIVHGGDQSMPLYFDNESASAFSETDHTFTLPQNWAANGIRTLSLWFHGALGNTGQLYVKINDTKVLFDGDAETIGMLLWQPWNIDLTTVGAHLNNIATMSIGVEGTAKALSTSTTFGSMPRRRNTRSRRRRMPRI